MEPIGYRLYPIESSQINFSSVATRIEAGVDIDTYPRKIGLQLRGGDLIDYLNEVRYR